jgi:hypothetical protein
MRSILRDALAIVALLILGYAAGYAIAEATVRAEYVTAECPNHDSLRVAVNEWRLDSPTRTLPVECK